MPGVDSNWYMPQRFLSILRSFKSTNLHFVLFRWYAAILECTGAAIASASVVSNGIDQQDAFMRTALHYAVDQGHTGVVKLLLDAGNKLFLI